jgi:hypothetical protein
LHYHQKAYIYCDEFYKCTLFDDNANLISYDGNHLTKEGAIFFGKFIEQKLRQLSVN